VGIYSRMDRIWPWRVDGVSNFTPDSWGVVVLQRHYKREAEPNRESSSCFAMNHGKPGGGRRERELAAPRLFIE